MDAKNMDIEVYPPRLQHLYTNFSYLDGKIYFGMRHIKHVGEKECQKIEQVASQEDVSLYTWMDVLLKIIYKARLCFL